MCAPALDCLKGRLSIVFAGRKPGIAFIGGFVSRTMDMELSGWHRLFMDHPGGGGLPVSNVSGVAAFFSDREKRIKDNLETCFPDATIHVFQSLPPENEPMHTALYFGRCLNLAGFPVDPEKAIQRALESALIQRVKLGKAELNSAWTMTLIRGVVLFITLYLSAGWLAAYFGNFTLEPVLKAMALTFLLGGFTNIGVVFFQKNLEFKKKVILEQYQRMGAPPSLVNTAISAPGAML